MFDQGANIIRRVAAEFLRGAEANRSRGAIRGEILDGVSHWPEEHRAWMARALEEWPVEDGGPQVDGPREGGPDDATGGFRLNFTSEGEVEPVITVAVRSAFEYLYRDLGSGTFDGGYSLGWVESSERLVGSCCFRHGSDPAGARTLAGLPGLREVLSNLCECSRRFHISWSLDVMGSPAGMIRGGTEDDHLQGRVEELAGHFDRLKGLSEIELGRVIFGDDFGNSGGSMR